MVSFAPRFAASQFGSHVTLSTSTWTLHPLLHRWSKKRRKTLMAKILFLLLTILLSTITTEAAAPVGQTIWIRASANGLFVSADQNRGTWAPLVADRSTVDAWEQFQVIDAGGGFIAFRSIGTGLFVSADQARGTFAPLVADRATSGTWEQFTWTDIAGGAFTLKGRALNRFVSADLNRGAALVCDRTAAEPLWGELFSRKGAKTQRK